jgi:hypothetical protein
MSHVKEATYYHKINTLKFEICARLRQICDYFFFSLSRKILKNNILKK